MNVPIEFILVALSMAAGVITYFFKSNSDRVSKAESSIESAHEKIVDIQLEVGRVKQSADESKRKRADDVFTMHSLSKQMTLLLEKIHELSLQLKDKQDKK
jgi:peptidoglycan hydrolase CwlO-like protein